MEPSVSDVIARWSAGPIARARTLGTGNDPAVARALGALVADAPADYDAYLRNVRDVYRVAEADFVIAAAHAAGYGAALVYTRSGTWVHFSAPGGAAAGAVAIRFELEELDPGERGEPHSWRLTLDVPDALATVMARSAPSWVVVQRESPSGAVVVRRGPSRRRPPRSWIRLLPMLRTPPREGY